MDNLDLLDYREAAELLRCAPNTLRKKVMLGVVPHVKPFGGHGRTFFLKRDILDFIAESRVPVSVGREVVDVG